MRALFLSLLLACGDNQAPTPDAALPNCYELGCTAVLCTHSLTHCSCAPHGGERVECTVTSRVLTP